MMIDRSAPRLRAPQGLVLGVGSHAFVNWQPVGGTPDGVPMMDGVGQRVTNDLRDGEEVEVLSWRPTSRAHPQYQVRRLRDGREWWIAGTYLRRSASAAPLSRGPKGA